MSAPERPTLLLLHAFPFDARMWDEVLPRLETGDRPVLAPTLPAAPVRRTMAEWAEDVLMLAEGPILPVGVSMGGYLVFELWRRAPERIPALVLCDTRASAETDEGKVGREQTVATIREGGAEALWRAMEARVLSPSASAAARDRAREIVLGRDSEDLIAAVGAIRDRSDSTETAGTMSVPALVVVGEDDAVVSLADATALANALPDGRLRAVPQAGHVPPLERPESFAAIVSAFLEEVEA
jgi:3-oxoadipate enol-lactonase